MDIREEPLTAEIRGLIPGAAAEGVRLLGVPPTADPTAIIGAINQFVSNPPKPGFLKRVDNYNDRALPLGALWGEQLVRALGWTWTLVVEEDERSIGVFDARRSMGVYPFDYIYGCLEAKGVPTILLAFNMLREGGIPQFPDRAFENIMDGVQHIVPPPFP